MLSVRTTCTALHAKRKLHFRRSIAFHILYFSHLASCVLGTILDSSALASLHDYLRVIFRQSRDHKEGPINGNRVTRMIFPI